MRHSNAIHRSSHRAPAFRQPETPRARAIPSELEDLIQLARFLDNRFVIPGTGIRFGIDSLLGLIPGVGDALSALISFYIISRAKALGAPDRLITKMQWNVVIDTVIGAAPLIGDLFDVAFKANVRNVRLLLDHLGVERDLSGRDEGGA